MFFEIAPVLACEDTFNGEAGTSEDAVLQTLEPPFLDDFLSPDD